MNHPVTIALFYAFSAALIGFSLAVVFSKNIFRAALALTAALSCVAVFFVLLGADFLGASQVLVYIGGVMVIQLFVIVFFQRPPNELEHPLNTQWLPGAVIAVAIGGLLLFQFRQMFRYAVSTAEVGPTTAPLGRLLLGPWIVPFEVISLVLLAALIGAVLLSKKTSSEEND